MKGIRFCATGAALPHNSVSNEALSQRVDTSDDWIRSRTGIAARRIAGEGENLTQLASMAGAKALAAAGWDPASLDLILLATSSPDDLFGSAPRILFGDGAGALAIEACTPEENGLIGFRMASDGRKADCLNLRQGAAFEDLIPGVTSQRGGFEPIAMNGQEVYKFAVREVPTILMELLGSTGTSAEQLDWLLLHQANQRILNAVAERLGLPAEKVLSNLANYGNTSAATIPVMLHEAVSDGRIQAGDLIASSGFGAGLSWGAALWRWAGSR